MATPLMNLTLPIVGTTLSPTWATDLNTALTFIDSHNHSTGSGAKITPSGLNINTALTFNTFDAIQLRSTRFNSQTAVFSDSADVSTAYVVEGDLYYRNSAGVNVQITDGSGLNFASLGTIGGDFGQPGVNAAVTYSDSNKVYSFTQSSGSAAQILASQFKVTNAAVSSDSISIASNATAVAYTITLPDGVATTDQSIVVADTDGTLHFATNLSANLTLSGNNTYSGNTTYSGTPTVSGDITRSGTSTGGTYANATFTGAIIGTSTFNNPTINSATLTGTLTGGTFTSTTLTAPTINAATLTGAISSSATTTGGTYTGATFTNATFTGVTTGVGIVPIGGLVAIPTSYSGNYANSFSIPPSGTVVQGWQYCDGAVITGQTMTGNSPDLTDNRFLNGGSGSGGPGGSNTMTPSGTISGNVSSHFHNMSHSHGDTGFSAPNINHYHTGAAHTHSGPNHSHTGPNHTHNARLRTSDIQFSPAGGNGGWGGGVSGMYNHTTSSWTAGVSAGNRYDTANTAVYFSGGTLVNMNVFETSGDVSYGGTGNTGDAGTGQTGGASATDTGYSAPSTYHSHTTATHSGNTGSTAPTFSGSFTGNSYDPRPRYLVCKYLIRVS